MSTYLADPITFLLILVHLHKYMLTICLHCLLNGIKKKIGEQKKVLMLGMFWKYTIFSFFLM